MFSAAEFPFAPALDDFRRFRGIHSVCCLSPYYTTGTGIAFSPMSTHEKQALSNAMTVPERLFQSQTKTGLESPEIHQAGSKGIDGKEGVMVIGHANATMGNT